MMHAATLVRRDRRTPVVWTVRERGWRDVVFGPVLDWSMVAVALVLAIT